MNKVCLFLNPFHNGDIHMSRPYVVDLMNLLGNNNTYYYLHENNGKIIEDIKNITSIKDVKSLSDIHLSINTWIGESNMRSMFTGCNFVSYYDVMKFGVYTTLNLVSHMKPIEYYIPEISYSNFFIDNINTYFKDNHKPHILFCNNHTASGQCPQFSMSNHIDILSNIYDNYVFIISNKIDNLILKNNVIYAEDIIGADITCNLNEISYISKHCDYIIGRSSGPYSFSITKDTMFSKKFICFCNSKGDTWYLPTSTNITWSNDYRFESMINTIWSVIPKI